MTHPHYIDRKLAPCPFCGEAPTWRMWNGVTQAQCSGEVIDCPGKAVLAPVDLWNRRPAPMEAVAWRSRLVEGDIKTTWTLHHQQPSETKCKTVEVEVQALAVIPTEGLVSSATPIPTGALESGEVVNGPVQMVSVRFGDIQVNAPMPGFRHHHILAVASYFGHRHGEQGFADADGKFLTRKEAAQLALASGQVTKLIAGPDLYSEDIW